MADEIRVKGSVLSGVLTALELVAGWEGREGIVRELSADFAEEVRTNSIVWPGWYPIRWHRELLGATVRRSGHAAMRAAVRSSTRQNVGAVHKLLMRMISRDRLLAQGTSVFMSFFEAQASARRLDPTTTHVEWRECRGFDKNVWIAQAQTVEELVAMAGGVLKRSRVVSGGADGDTSMVFELGF